MHLQHTKSLFSHWVLQKSNCAFTAHPLHFRANIFAVLNLVHDCLLQLILLTL
jgi:hypothetical protein